MKFIGITGGVGAGKSTILEYISTNLNARVLLADEVAHQLMEPGTECYEELKRTFLTEDIFLPDGRIDKTQMAKLIFGDKEKRKRLNAIVHPAVKRYVVNEYEKEKKAGKYDYLVLEAALLIEEHYDENCDERWYVYTTEENRKIRLQKNKGYSEGKIQEIFTSQLPEKTYRDHCVVEIDNNGGSEDTIAALKSVIKERTTDE